jgi:hypothetical protein
LPYQLIESNVDVRLLAGVAEPRHPIEISDFRQAEGKLIAIPSAAPAAAAPTSITTISSTASAALDLGARFVHVQGASANLSAVQSGDGFFSVFSTGHFHKAEAARAPGIPVGHDADAVHLSVYLEEFAQFVFRRVEIEVANKDVLQASCL